jgi:hypothetical protein
MMSPTGHAGLSLLIQVARSDTVLMRQVGQAHSSYELLTAGSNLILSVSFVVLVALLLGAAWEIRRMSRETHAMITRISGDATPLIQQAAVIVTNIYTITNSLRERMDKVTATIDRAEAGLNTAVVQTEARLNEFNALLAVVQEEAEAMFVSTASAVRGVRAGASSLHQDDEAFDGDDDVDDPSEELNDGNDDDPHGQEERTSGPRVRARRG